MKLFRVFSIVFLPLSNILDSVNGVRKFSYPSHQSKITKDTRENNFNNKLHDNTSFLISDVPLLQVYYNTSSIKLQYLFEIPFVKIM